VSLVYLFITTPVSARSKGRFLLLLLMSLGEKRGNIPKRIILVELIALVAAVIIAAINLNTAVAVSDAANNLFLPMVVKPLLTPTPTPTLTTIPSQSRSLSNATNPNQNAD
jgi:hypothetical protein